MLLCPEAPAAMTPPPAPLPIPCLPSAGFRCRDVRGAEDPWFCAALDVWRRSFPERERAPLTCWAGRLGEPPTARVAGRRLLAAAAAGGEGRSVGMCYYEVRRAGPDEPPVGYLVYLATDPERRNRGLGTTLYREAVSRMFAAGCRCVVFEVESPEAVGALNPADGELARRRMAWYRRNGALLLGGAVALAGIGGPQPLPEAILLHPRPGEGMEGSPECALVCARVGLGAGAVERTAAPLTLA